MPTSAPTHPLPLDRLHGGEEHLELLDGDAVAGQDAHQVHEEVDDERGGAPQPVQQVLQQAGLRAGLQVADGLAQRRREHGPVC